jgi:hypothetical protein
MPDLLFPGNIPRLFGFCKLTANIRNGNWMAELMDDPMNCMLLFARATFQRGSRWSKDRKAAGWEEISLWDNTKASGEYILCFQNIEH